jgi:hypothetical protein
MSCCATGSQQCNAIDGGEKMRPGSKQEFLKQAMQCRSSKKSSNAIAGFMKRVQISAYLGTPTRKLTIEEVQPTQPEIQTT